MTGNKDSGHNIYKELKDSFSLLFDLSLWEEQKETMLDAVGLQIEARLVHERVRRVLPERTWLTFMSGLFLNLNEKRRKQNIEIILVCFTIQLMIWRRSEKIYNKNGFQKCSLNKRK
ncbi:hypothetical protein XENOCAPTIV_002032 [Xenoophorus captivus]|uniref:Uncharacterized protein n=1 Tax=Xenoophorus captivus TaxID=1517983 RepID=A0ABV0QQB8_9TELE